MAVAAIAAEQHGMITREQLRRVGFSDDMIDSRIAIGSLVRVHRGVYRVGPVVAARSRELAACLACGVDACTGSSTAAFLWQALPPLTVECDVDILVTRGFHHHPGIRVHRVAGLRPDEVTRVDGVPVTTPARTLLDIATVVTDRELERAVAQCLARRLVTPPELRATLERWSGRAGTAVLRRCLADAPALTRSEAEERFLGAVRRAQLPEPRTNVKIAGYEVDVVWSDERLVVEIDGYAFHAPSDSFEKDRRRDQVLTSRGFRVVRITWRQLVHEPDAVMVRVAQALVWGR